MTNCTIHYQHRHYHLFFNERSSHLSRQKWISYKACHPKPVALGSSCLKIIYLSCSNCEDWWIVARGQLRTKLDERPDAVALSDLVSPARQSPLLDSGAHFLLRLPPLFVHDLASVLKFPPKSNASLNFTGFLIVPFLTVDFDSALQGGDLKSF